MKIALSVSEKEKAKGVESPYYKALLAAGAAPEEIQIVTAADKGWVSNEDFDGILLTGGEDVDPELYGEEVKYPNVKVNRGRDNF
ncbi:MAG: gamma-glutamyl-gamma-aminobutyrate hydrolase family protein, partial [Acidobacteriota bacterium]